MLGLRLPIRNTHNVTIKSKTLKRIFKHEGFVYKVIVSHEKFEGSRISINVYSAKGFMSTIN